MLLKYLKNINFKILFIITILFLFSLLMISSATDNQILDMNRFVKIQTISFVLGLVLIVVVIAIDYDVLGNFHWIIYLLSLGLLLSVYIPGLGVIRNGARSWIDLGPIDLQTSELAKLGIIIFYAKFFSHEDRQFKHIKDLIIPVMLLMPFMGLILAQPDLGTALVFVIIFIGLLFVAGLNLKILGFGAILGGLSIPLIYDYLEPHQKLRIDAFLNPNDPSLPGNYQVFQSKITIGSGQLNGRGIFEGIYHKYNYLPVRESDFIYAVVGEETGFIGASIVLGLYVFFLVELMNTAKKAKDKFGAYIITGVTFMFAFQIFQNIGMTIGLMPVTGITLPFLSYGGSSIITNMLAIGLVFNVYSRRMRMSELME